MANRVINYIWKQAQAYRKGRTRKGKPETIQTIVLHSTDGREQGDVDTLTGKKVSSHWYITRKGKTYHFVADSDTAYHAGNATSKKYENVASIGIEQEHIDGKDDWPDAQVQATARISAYLCNKYNLNPRNDIRSHAYIASPRGRKQDPVGFPWNKYFSWLYGALDDNWSVERVDD